MVPKRNCSPKRVVNENSGKKSRGSFVFPKETRNPGTAVSIFKLLTRE